jgi:hypothetical protein
LQNDDIGLNGELPSSFENYLTNTFEHCIWLVGPAVGKKHSALEML